MKRPKHTKGALQRQQFLILNTMLSNRLEARWGWAVLNEATHQLREDNIHQQVVQGAGREPIAAGQKMGKVEVTTCEPQETRDITSKEACGYYKGMEWAKNGNN